MQERYDYACVHYMMRIKDSGIRLPRKYFQNNGHFMKYEPDHRIGEHFRELRNIYGYRKCIKKETKFLSDDGRVVDYAKKQKREIKSYLLKDILNELVRNGINWECEDHRHNWLLLVEPKSQKRIKIQIDQFGDKRNGVNINALAYKLKMIAKCWSNPFNPDGLNQGTLTNCGWRARFPKGVRQEALQTAIILHGKSHIRKALQVTYRSAWTQNYTKQIEEDILYVNGSKIVRPRSRKYDILIYVYFS